MIDIHCHILPGVDDGAQTLTQSLEMARMAAQSGVQVIAATPHCNLPGAPEQNFATDELADRFCAFREAVRAEDIPLELTIGAEVLCSPELETLIRENRLVTLGGSRYLLVEFFFEEPAGFMEDRLACVAAQGLIPVVAHPERYEAVQDNPAMVEGWFSKGYILQLNKGSIQGRLGRRAEVTAQWLLRQGLAHAVASDAHSPLYRTTRMDTLRDDLIKLCGPAYAKVLLHDNPLRILKDKSVLEA